MAWQQVVQDMVDIFYIITANLFVPDIFQQCVKKVRFPQQLRAATITSSDKIKKFQIIEKEIPNRGILQLPIYF